MRKLQRSPKTPVFKQGNMITKEPFGIVVPTRNDPERCLDIVRRISADVEQSKILRPIQVILLVNDTDTETAKATENAVIGAGIKNIAVRFIFSPQNYLTVEENIFRNLGDNLATLTDKFIIPGNSDRIQIDALMTAIDEMETHGLDL